jgi:5'-3' exonuclease
MKKLTIIDLDSIVYIVAYKNKDENFSSIVQEATRLFIDDILLSTHSECYSGYYQKKGHTNYRKLFYPEYKANRSETPEYITKWRGTIHRVFAEYAGFVGLNVIESDDALSIALNKYKKEYDVTLAYIDKDLHCLPCTQYHYKRNEFIEHKQSDCELFAKAQVLAGDSGDNIPGIRGVGLKTAMKHVTKEEPVSVTYTKVAKLKGSTTWLRDFYRDYSCVHLLENIQDLKRYTDRQEVNIFKISCGDLQEDDNYFEEDFDIV